MAFVEKVEALSLFQDRIEKPSRMPQVWNAFREEIEHLITSTAIALFLVDQTTHAFELNQWAPDDCAAICRREIDAQIECGTFAWIVNRRQPAIIPSLAFRGPHTLVMLPLATHSRTLGVAMIVATIEDKAVTHERLRLLGILSKQCALVMENTLLYDRLKAEHLALKDAQAQIIQSEKFASFGRLTSGAFHEILNPLNIISGHLQLMMLEDKREGPVSDYLTSMKAAADRIVAITKGLLKFSTQQSHQGAPLEIAPFLRRVVGEISHGLAHRNITVDMAVERDLPPVNVNEDDLRTVVLHLLDNAGDAMPEGGHLKIDAKRSLSITNGDKGRLMVEVAIGDNGCGIAESDTLKVFDPFFTTKTIGNGMGLSLAVSYALVCSMGGTLTFESTPGQGTIFWIRLPSHLPYP